MEEFDELAFDPCWKTKCGGNCRDCGLRTKRNAHFEKVCFQIKMGMER
jgi:hypothetical protein